MFVYILNYLYIAIIRDRLTSQEIRVETAEMNCGGGSPKYMTDVMVRRENKRDPDPKEKQQ